MLDGLACLSHDFPVQRLLWLRTGHEQFVGVTFPGLLWGGDCGSWCFGNGL